MSLPETLDLADRLKFLYRNPTEDHDAEALLAPTESRPNC
jgi:hypothetical protein